jgi:hypothetical protein
MPRGRGCRCSRRCPRTGSLGCAGGGAGSVRLGTGARWRWGLLVGPAPSTRPSPLGLAAKVIALAPPKSRVFHSGRIATAEEPGSRRERSQRVTTRGPVGPARARRLGTARALVPCRGRRRRATRAGPTGPHELPPVASTCHYDRSTGGQRRGPVTRLPGGRRR